jgi:hypothetical protein
MEATVKHLTAFNTDILSIYVMSETQFAPYRHSAHLHYSDRRHREKIAVHSGNTKCMSNFVGKYEIRNMWCIE